MPRPRNEMKIGPKGETKTGKKSLADGPQLQTPTALPTTPKPSDTVWVQAMGASCCLANLGSRESRTRAKKERWTFPSTPAGSFQEWLY